MENLFQTAYQLKDNTMRKIFEKLNAHPERVEFGILDDVENLKKRVLGKVKSADKNILGGLSDLADATQRIEQVIRITDDMIQKAKDLGADEFVSRGQKIKSDFANQLGGLRNAISDLREARGKLD